jgi:hypothetical protein
LAPGPLRLPAWARLVCDHVAFACRRNAARAQCQLVGCLLTLAWSERAVKPGEAHCYVDVLDKVPSFGAAKTARRSSSSLDVMNDLANRTLLIASYLVMSTNMAIELVAHPAAKDHVASSLGLGFCVIILAALLVRRPFALVSAATVLNAWIALFGAYLLIDYLARRGITWEGAPDLVVRFYFAVIVPAFAIRYFIINAQRERAARHDV